MKRSAGILMYRIEDGELRVLLVHPGGPLFTKKDAGWWSIPKGEYLDDEDAILAAVRELQEETGAVVDPADLIELGSVRQKSGKVVTAWGIEADFDVTTLVSNLFELEWPPRSRGIIAVISPWNFPLAIACGMTSAALVTGNAVVLKPAEQSPAMAGRLVEALHAGGVPPAALSLLPGEGEVGAALVRHPEVAAIAFTGSLPVGQEIVRAAAELADGQRQFKSVIAELGGKNCVIVDSDADLDEAVPGIVGSAFAFAGQKCSAASRVLVCEAVADQLLERVAGAASVLVVGQADTLGTDVPPVIEQAAQERVARYRAIAEREGRLVATAAAPAGPGWFCPATIAADLPEESAVLGEEIFGPLLAIQRVRDVSHACDIVEELPFALTGGLFTRNPATVRTVRARTPVGNLYVNRGITGAMVGRQPFGGNRLSGTGLKAGGPDYLLQFVQQLAVSENTMRHGLEV